MDGWAGFWICAGLLFLALGISEIGEGISCAAKTLAKAYRESFKVEDNDE